MSKASFPQLRRQTLWMCIGHLYGPHPSKGQPHTINGNGPYCGNCIRTLHEEKTGESFDPITGLKN